MEREAERADRERKEWQESQRKAAEKARKIEESEAEEAKRGMGGSSRISEPIHPENGATHRAIHHQGRQPNSRLVHDAMGAISGIIGRSGMR